VSSDLQAVLEVLEMIWAPGGEAVRAQQALGVRSLSEVSPALERGGYEVCYVDLPMKVSGFANVIEGKPHIGLNRAKSVPHLHYTVGHELGHHILHLDTSRKSRSLSLAGIGAAEFQAHQFATVWTFLLANDRERQEVMTQNPESLAIGAVMLLMTAGAILALLIAHVCSLLSRTLPPVPNN